MIEHAAQNCREVMRWKFCRRHDRRFLALPLLVFAVCALEVMVGNRTPRQVASAVIVLGIIVPVASWLIKQAPIRVGRAMFIAMVTIWLASFVLALLALSSPEEFLRLLQAVRIR